MDTTQFGNDGVSFLDEDSVSQPVFNKGLRFPAMASRHSVSQRGNMKDNSIDTINSNIKESITLA